MEKEENPSFTGFMRHLNKMPAWYHEERARYEVQACCPRSYSVMLLNDPDTPIEYVGEILQRFFNKSPAIAQSYAHMLRVEGQVLCGYYPRDLAETLVVEVIQDARQHQHPLKCIMQKGTANAFQKS